MPSGGLLLLLLLLGAVSGLPDGAPAGRADLCSSLRPRHGSHLPQQGAAPFSLTAEPASSPPGHWLVTLRADQLDRPFRGVLLQARSASGGDVTPLGRFRQANGTHVLDCSGRAQVRQRQRQ